MKTAPETRRKVRLPTATENARINAGIEADLDNPELGDEFFRSAKPAVQVLGQGKLNELATLRRPRGRPLGSVAKSRKVPVTVRMDPDVLEALRNTGTGWQTRVNDALRKAFVHR